MKYIPKFQAAGQIFASPLQNPFYGQPSAKKIADEDAGKLVSDDMLKGLVKNGITSDVNKFTDLLISIENKYKYSSVPKAAMYKLYAYANQIVKQSDALKLAEAEATKNGSLSEIAVDDKGFIFIKKQDGSIGKKHMKDYNPEQDYGLSFGELLDERRTNESLVDDDSVATVVKKSVGLNKINEYLKKIIDAVGSTEDSSEAYHELAVALGAQYARRPSSDEQAAMQELKNLVDKLGEDAIFKLKDSQKSKNIDKALSYIFSMLPSNMKTQLQANYVAQGGNYKDSVHNIQSIISQALIMSNDVKRSFEIDYQKDINEAAGTSAGKKGAEKINQLTPLELFFNGDLNEITYTITNKSNPNLEMKLNGTGMPTYANTNGNTTGRILVSDMMKDFATGIDQNHMQIGDQKITPNMLSKIVYDGGQVINVWAPTNSNGDVDLSLLSKLSAVQNHIKNNKEFLTPQDMNQLLQENNVPGFYDEKGQYIPDTSSMEQFAVFTGITSDKIIKDENDFAYTLKKDESEYLADELKTIYAKSNGKDGKQEFPFSFFTSLTTYKAAPIFMKIDKGAQQYAGAYAGHGPSVTKPTLQSQMMVEARQNAGFTFQKPSTSMLLNN